MTTTSRVDSYLAGIDTAAIPETVLDAIRVTISMGYQYLWVDAFCIVQDSGPSKIAELGRMASIYSGAVCTICVMSAKAATEGFLRQAYSGCIEDQLIHTWHVDIGDATSQEVAAVLEIRSDFSYQAIWDSPILERAWTFQEALLSPRLVMFFSQGQRPSLRCSIRTVQSDGGWVTALPKPLVSLGELEKVVEVFSEIPYIPGGQDACTHGHCVRVADPVQAGYILGRSLVHDADQGPHLENSCGLLSTVGLRVVHCTFMVLGFSCPSRLVPRVGGDQHFRGRGLIRGGFV